MAKVHVKKGDRVMVTAGRDRGRQGKVLRVLPNERRAIVEGMNFIKKHTRPNPQRRVKGGILEKEAPLRLDNLKVVCSECDKPSRVGRKALEDDTTVRYCKSCGATLP